MSSSVLACPNCRQPLADAGTPAADCAALRSCPQCRQALEITPLPGFGRELTQGQAGAQRTSDAEAACFFHPAKQAEVPCDLCGRFLCSLCQLELAGQNVCPACLGDAGRRPGAALLERERFRWDLLVWLLVVGPPLSLCLWFVTPFSCLFAIGLGAWKLRSLPSRIHRSRARMISGMIAAGLIVAGSAVLVTLAIQSKI